MRKFAFSQTPLSVYEHEFSISVPVRWDASSPPVLSGQLEYQACNDTQCLPPATARVPDRRGRRRGRFGGAGICPAGRSRSRAAPPSSGAPGPESEFGRSVADRGYLLVLLSVFVGGLALNLTPCVYPVIPLTIGFFGRQSAGSRGRLLGLASLYVLGIVVMYSALGVAASLSGQLFGAALQNRWVLGEHRRDPRSSRPVDVRGLRAEDAAVPDAPGGGRVPHGSRGRPTEWDCSSGIVAAPCVAPFTLGLLAFVAERRNVLLGVLFFAVLSLGLGLPYLFLALFSGNLSRLPRAGEWMEGVKKVFGWLLLAMAAYFLRLVLPRPWSEWLLPATLALGAVVLVVRGFGLARVARFAAAVRLPGRRGVLPAAQGARMAALQRGRPGPVGPPRGSRLHRRLVRAVSRAGPADVLGRAGAGAACPAGPVQGGPHARRDARGDRADQKVPHPRGSDCRSSSTPRARSGPTCGSWDSRTPTSSWNGSPKRPDPAPAAPSTAGGGPAS